MNFSSFIDTPEGFITKGMNQDEKRAALPKKEEEAPKVAHPLKTDDASGPPAKKAKFMETILTKPHLFWKVAKPNYAVQMICCKPCTDYNFKSSEKFAVRNDRLFVTLSFCPECVKTNYDITDIHLKKKV